MTRLHHAGQDAPAGDYRCALCGYDLALEAARQLPLCPTCGGDAYEDLSPRGAPAREGPDPG